jgi:hypothetical protein
LTDMPTWAYEDANGKLTNRNAAKIKERSFIILIFLICNHTWINQFHKESTKYELRRQKAFVSSGIKEGTQSQESMNYEG